MASPFSLLWISYYAIESKILCGSYIDVLMPFSFMYVGMAGRNKHTWTNEEDAKLIDALMELHASGKYAGADNGFKPGYLNGVQKLLEVSLPNSGLKAEPHIKSRMKTWNKHFNIVYDMVHTSGFGWDEEKNCVVAEDSVWEEYVKVYIYFYYFSNKLIDFLKNFAYSNFTCNCFVVSQRCRKFSRQAISLL